MKNTILICLTFLCLDFITAQVNYSEATDGELPETLSLPLPDGSPMFTLGPGTNTWQGTLGGAVFVNTDKTYDEEDVFHFYVPANLEVLSVSYSGPDNSLDGGRFEVYGINEIGTFVQTPFLGLDNYDGQYYESFSSNPIGFDPEVAYVLILGSRENENNYNWSLTIITEEIPPPCTPAAPVSISNLSGVPACPNTTVTLQVNGDLNDDQSWYWYTGSCGGGPIGIGSSISVNVAEESTYYVRGQGDCSEANGDCASITVSIVDNQNPSITCPNNIVKVNDPGACGAVINYTPPVGTDNCPGVTTRFDFGLGSGAFFPIGETIEVYTVVQATGLAHSCSFSVTVNDNSPPSITCPATQNIPLDVSCLSSHNNYINLAIVSDNCDASPTVTQSPPDGTLITANTTATLTATDNYGNAASCTFNVNVVDGNIPVIACPSNITKHIDQGICGAVVSYNTPVGTDNCSGVTTALSSGFTSGATFPLGLTPVTYQVTDASGLQASCSFDVTVIDPTTPITSIVASNNPVCAGSSTTLTASGGSESAGTIIRWYDGPNGTGNMLGSGASIQVAPTQTTTYLVRRENACGATTDASITINVSDFNVYVNTISSFTKDETCPGAADGGVDVIAELATATGFEFSIDDGQNWFYEPAFSGSNGRAFTDLTNGDYTILVRDFNHPECQTSIDHTINTTNTESTPLTESAISINPVCPGENTVLTVSGGVDGTGSAIKWYTAPNGGGFNVNTGPGPITITSSNPVTNFYVRREGICNNTEDLVVSIFGDTEKPTLVCQDISVNLGPGGNITISPDDVTSLKSDNCRVNLFSHTVSQNNFSAPGDFEVTVSIMDISNNMSECTANVTVGKRLTTLVNNGVFTGQYTDNVTLSATLTDDLDGGSGITGKTINFNLGIVNTSAITDANGVASVNITLDQLPGDYTFTTSYAGDGTFEASSDSDPFILTKASTILTNLNVFSGQYSDVVTLQTQLLNTANNSPVSGENIAFEIAGLPSMSGVTDAMGMTTVDIKLDQALGNYTWTSSYAGSNLYLASTDSDNFEIQQEDAIITYTGAYFASTAGQNSSEATVTLAATIQDAMDGAGNEGDISNATVTFVDRNGGIIAADLPVILIEPSDPSTGSVVYNWNVDIGNLDSEIFDIGIIVGNYYLRNASDDEVMVTVSKPLNNFATGGGYINIDNAGGTLAADADTKMNFGFNVKFNPSGNKPKGKVDFTFRRTESDGVLHTYRVKSNKINSIAFNPSDGDAVAMTINGKCNITDVTDPYNLVSLGGNRIFQLNATDNGNPGVQNDLLGITIYGDGGGLLFASNWSGTNTIAQLLDGGNIKVQTSNSGGNGMLSNNTGAEMENNRESTEPLDQALLSFDELRLFPNPAMDHLQIEFQAGTENEAILEIIHLNGSIVLREKLVTTPGLNQKTLRLDRLKNGMYWIRISGDEGLLSKRFISLGK